MDSNDKWSTEANESVLGSLMRPENTFVGLDPLPEQNAMPGSISSIQDFAESDTFTPLESLLEMPLNIDWVY